jgi:hypothetical protein
LSSLLRGEAFAVLDQPILRGEVPRIFGTRLLRGEQVGIQPSRPLLAPVAPPVFDEAGAVFQEDDMPAAYALPDFPEIE